MKIEQVGTYCHVNGEAFCSKQHLKDYVLENERKETASLKRGPILSIGKF